MKTILSFALSFFIPGLLMASDPYPLNPAVDVQHYAFRLALSADTDTITGKAVLVVLLKEDLNSFSLDLQNESSRGGMKITSMKVNEKTSTYKHQNNRVLIEVKGKAGEMLILSFDYKGVPEDGLIIENNMFGDRTFFGDNWPDRAHHWLPTVDHPADKATCEFIIEAPVFYQVIANGTKKEETILDNETKITHWKSTAPISTKVMVFGAAPFAVEQVGFVDNIPVSSWVYRQNKNAGFYDYAPAKEILATLQQIIGSYPFEKLANVQSKTRYGGMENAGNIFYSETSVTGERDIEDLMAHEIAHQWFGNSASEKDWHHVWLSEGFATYFTQVYREQTYGVDSLRAGMKRMLPKIEEYHHENPGSPIVDTTIVELTKVLSTNSYQKAGWVLHMLRKQMGDNAFFTGIRSYYDKYKLSNALTSDFQAVMEKASGQKLGWFFKQWLLQPAFPSLDVSWTYNQKSGTVLVKVLSSGLGKGAKLPLEIGVRNSIGELEIHNMEVSGKSSQSEWKVAAKPAVLIADPNVWLLAKINMTGK